MTDRISRETRSRNMSRIRSANTAPEWAVRRMLTELGFRYRLHRRDLPGTPDIVFVAKRKVIFVHGCFWHGHARCARASQPASNVNFWAEKISGNKARDRAATSALKRKGWDVCIVWQCELRRPATVQSKLSAFLSRDLISA
jgi:DNA mismatch endonuclease, patch repair protein